MTRVVIAAPLSVFAGIVKNDLLARANTAIILAHSIAGAAKRKKQKIIAVVQDRTARKLPRINYPIGDENAHSDQPCLPCLRYDMQVRVV